MATWCGASRSNYFRVKDPDSFYKWANELRLEVWRKNDLVAIAPTDYGEGSWPSIRRSKNGRRDIDLDFPNELASHLLENEVAVLQTVGSEKRRHLTGCSVAINHKGELLVVDIEDIYDLVKRNWSIKTTFALY